MVFAASFAFDIFSTRPRSAAWFTSESGNAPNAGSNHLFSAPRIDGTLLSGIGHRFQVTTILTAELTPVCRLDGEGHRAIFAGAKSELEALDQVRADRGNKQLIKTRGFNHQDRHLAVEFKPRCPYRPFQPLGAEVECARVECDELYGILQGAPHLITQNPNACLKWRRYHKP